MGLVLTDDSNYKAIADSLRTYTFPINASFAEFSPSEMADGVKTAYDNGHAQGRDAGYQDGYQSGHSVGEIEGAQSEYDRFWDAFQQSGNRRNYPSCFAGSGWTDAIFNPKYEIIVTSIATNMFVYSSVITSTKVPITIDSTVACTGVFMACTRLKTIPSLTVTAKVASYSNWFQDCTALENITFTDGSVIAASISFQWSTKLSKASIESIFNALSGTASGKSLTLSKTAVNNAFTDAEWATLANTKSNWTINLV